MHSQEARESSNNSSSASSRYICFGTYHLDLKKEELFKDGTRVKLQGKVYRALVALLQKPGEIVTREELRLQLWPDALVNYDPNVNTTVNKLRQVVALTSEITVNYLKPVPLNQPLRVESREVKVKSRKHINMAEILNEKREVLARSEGVFIAIDPHRMFARFVEP